MDYYVKLAELDEDKLLSEIETISDKMYKARPGSEIYQQLLTMYQDARQMYEEKLFLKRAPTEADSESLDIGTMDEVITTPDYSTDELVNIVVDAYRDKI